MNWSAWLTWWMPPRTSQQELLDAPDIPVSDLHGNLLDLQRLNRYLGSHWLVLRTLQRLWRQAGCPQHLWLLDVGTGAGDMPLVLQQWGQHRGVQLSIVAIDNHQGVIRYAHAALRGIPSIALMQADGHQLPFRGQVFDVVVCSTMLHHLEWQDGVALLRAMAAVARYGVIVNDLVRSWLHYYGARGVLAVLSRNRLTRHDGPLSVLRAYSVSEVRAMANAAGLHNAQVHQALGYRWLLIYTPEA